MPRAFPAVVELIPPPLLQLVVLNWLVCEAVELVEIGLERQQTLFALPKPLFALFEHGAESLDLVLRVILRTLSEGPLCCVCSSSVRIKGHRLLVAILQNIEDVHDALSDCSDAKTAPTSLAGPLIACPSHGYVFHAQSGSSTSL